MRVADTMNIMRKFLPGGASTSQSSTTQVGDAGDGAGASTSKPPEQVSFVLLSVCQLLLIILLTSGATWFESPEEIVLRISEP